MVHQIRGSSLQDTTQRQNISLQFIWTPCFLSARCLESVHLYFLPTAL